MINATGLFQHINPEDPNLCIPQYPQSWFSITINKPSTYDHTFLCRIYEYDVWIVKDVCLCLAFMKENRTCFLAYPTSKSLSTPWPSYKKLNESRRRLKRPTYNEKVEQMKQEAIIYWLFLSPHRTTQ